MRLIKPIIFFMVLEFRVRFRMNVNPHYISCDKDQKKY